MVMSLRRGRRVQITPPIPVVTRVDPFTAPVDLDSPIAPDQESAIHELDPDAAYRLAAWTWGHSFGVSWAAYVAGLPLSHKWTLAEMRALRFLRDLHRKKDLS